MGRRIVVYTSRVNAVILAPMAKDRSDPPRTPDRPAYEQVKDWIRQHIASGDWKPGDPVPSEATLMGRFGVSRMTAHRALRELATEGLVMRVQGSGTTVAQLHRISSQLVIRDIREEVAERGHVAATRVLTVGSEKAGAEVAGTLRLRKGARVFHSVMVHLENGVPIQYEDRYVNPQAAPDYLATDFEATSPTSHLLRHAPLTEASYSIEACLPTAAEARALAMSTGEPCLVMMRRTVSGAHVASVARLLYPASRYSFSGTFQA
jgi:GntR family histidine utilization transcriptional repressor